MKTSKKPNKKQKLGPFEFACKSCGKVEQKSSYCIAQQAGGVTIIFTCACGHTMEVPQ